MRLLAALAGLAALVNPAWAAIDCGDVDNACEIDGGSYHIRLPDGWDGETAMPAVVFYHGHNATGRMIFNAGSLKSAFLDHGYAVIAPNGLRLDGSQTGSYPARIRPDAARDDVAFSLNVLDDVMARVPLQDDKVFVSGFSAGGSMAWMMACYAGERFAGFAPVAGTLRRPIPEVECPSGPVRMLHIHGFSDRQVPLEGRGIRDWHQGDVFEALSLVRKSNACRTNPDQIDIGERYSCRSWTSCDNEAIKLCLHDGGHGLPPGWGDLARDWFEGK